MSHYSKAKTKITDAAKLMKALADLGFGVDKAQYHELGKHLRGYMGDERPEAAEIIIPKRYVGDSSNDIGFKKQADGTFAAIISEFDQDHHKYNQDWLNKVNQRYAYHGVKEQIENMGFYVDEEREENGEILIECNSNY